MLPRSNGAPSLQLLSIILVLPNPRCTTGSAVPKLSKGVGDSVLHSSVVACHGFFSLSFAPRQTLQRKLKRKIPCAAMVTIVAPVMKLRTVAPATAAATGFPPAARE